MSASMEELLAQYALGILPPEEHERVERYLADAEDGPLELRELEDAAASLGTALEPPRSRSNPFRQQLVELGRGSTRFVPFIDRVARLFDVSADAAQRALALVDDPAVWKRLRPGCRYVDVEGGPGLGARHAGLVRMDPGAVFPRHSHQGDEDFIILHGRARDSLGRRMQPGDQVRNADGTEHRVEVEGDQELIYAIVLGRYTIEE